MTILELKRNNKKTGQAMLTAVIFFLAISMTIVIGIALPIIRQVQAGNDLIHSKESYFLAEGFLEDAVYRVQSGKDIVSGETLVVNNYTTTLTVTTTGSGKTLDAVSDRGGYIRKMEASVVTGIGATFNYGIQAGAGGFTLSGGSKINGNVYSNGPIIAGNGETITGSAIAANSAALASDQSNTSPTPISSCTFSGASANCIKFGDTSTTQDLAQSFQISTSSPMHDIKFYIEKVSTPGDLTVRIVADSSGSPSGTTIMSGTLSAASVTTSFGWVDVTLPSTPILDPSSTYWVVLDGATNASKYYVIGANTSYTSGLAKVGQLSGTWNNTNPSGLDAYFNLYLGGVTSYIGTGSWTGSTNTGSAVSDVTWAHTVNGDQVTGSLYCQASNGANSKVCDTSRADPPAQGYPLSDAIIQSFKDEATTTAGGWTYSGNLTIGSSGTTTTTLKKISGNLTINGGGTATIADLEVTGNVTVTGGGTLIAGPLLIDGDLAVGSTGLTLKGTMWVKGNMAVNSGAAVKLSSSYGSNSGTIIVDGYADLTGGGSYAGSGTTGSFPLLIDTSSCPADANCSGHNAIDISGGAGAVVLNAQNGTIGMSGGTSARSLGANQISVTGGGTVNYDTGLANLNFSSGPSGGYDISSWKEVQ